MDEKAVVEFISQDKKIHVDLEIPLGITANDLVLALNEAYDLGIDTDDILTVIWQQRIQLYSYVEIKH